METNFGRKLYLKLKGVWAAALTALKARYSSSRPTRKSDLKKVGQNNFIAGSCMHINGSLKYHVFTPTNYAAGMPLLVMLHGCKQDAEMFATGTRMNQLAEEFGFVVLYPTQSRMANPNQCWNWYQSINQHRNMGEPSVIADMTRDIIETYKINPHKVFIAGLSAGGAMAYIVGSQYPELYAGIGVHSGLLYRGINNMFTAMAAMKTGTEQIGKIEELQDQFMEYANGQHTVPHAEQPLIVFHGDNDLVVDAQNALDLMAYHHQENSFEERQEESSNHYGYTRTSYQNEQGASLAEQWIIHGAGHAWSGGNEEGNFADANGPDASAEMVRFFMQ